jgi:hypothetical protein
VEAGEWTSAWRLAADTSFLEAKCRELGAHEIEADVARVANHSGCAPHPRQPRRSCGIGCAGRGGARIDGAAAGRFAARLTQLFASPDQVA